MAERHTVDFARCSFNVINDADRRTITVQFENPFPGPRVVPESVDRILKAIRQRFGGGIVGRLTRWSRGESNPLVLPQRGHAHPDNPDVLCFEIGVKDGARIEGALATLLDFLRRQPGYQRTYGAPLDRDPDPSEDRIGSTRNASTAAREALIGLLARLTRRNEPPPART
jgi:hypothetical protein